MQMKVLIVEDDSIALAVLTRVIAQAFDCSIASHRNGFEALTDCATATPDLVFVDYQMPGLNGVDFIRRLRQDARNAHVPVVMITAERARGVRIEAMEAGATDFLSKPVDPQEMKIRARNLLSLREAQLKLADRARLLASEVEQATRRLVEREEEVIWRLARAIEYRDGGTGEHIARVAAISRIIAEEIGLEAEHRRNIYLGAALHDVGKVGIPDSILNKPGKLTPEEFATIKGHVDIGTAILSNGDSDLIKVAEAIVSAHHERWDGSGYPQGLAGEAIPIEGRIVAVADVFDALFQRRAYKPAWHPEAARAEIMAQSGRHFDPACVAAFERGWSQVIELLEAEATPRVA